MQVARSAGTLGTVFLVCVSAAVPAPASARPRHRIVPPSEDAIQLSEIAPPTRRATAKQTYGDAVYARERMQSRYRRETDADAAEASAIGTPYPCDPRAATADAYLCRNDPRALGYGQGYAFTPSYVSSPTVFNQAPDAQAPAMPSVTGFFWALNSARIDPH